MRTWAIVVAAGSGSRFGGPKQFERLGGRRVLDWSLAAAAEACDGVVCVLPPPTDDHDEPLADHAVAGGDTRSASVRAGLAAVPDDADVIVVHDAARPVAGASLFRAVVDAVVDGADAAIPAIPLHDTIRHTTDGVVNRAELVAVQTPQAFRAGVLRSAHAGTADATDDAALVESIGGSVTVVPGDPHNLKITDPGDLRVAAVFLEGAV